MKYTLFLSLTLTTLFLVSCGPKEKFEGPLKDINTYQSKLDSVEKVMEDIPFDSLETILKEIHQNEKDVKKYFKDDTLDMMFAQAMTEFKSIRKKIKSPRLKESAFQKEIDALQKQLKDLKHDITNGVLSEEEVQKFTAKEIADSKILIQKFSLFQNTAEKSMDVYYTYKEIIQSTIQKLKDSYENSPA